ncbi:SDR family oxidoreductase [Agromyces aerolatus]|uniref:SDR family oxidoreductase n=1 Tax=Agromyces sp. LY-1074 TaxID=3074080 RepID=UPI002854B994|nr:MULTISPECIES: NAD(P)H-binding protein [unclassified Agromyces]MDR5699659.1 NAD(P)H-binding protein [Agromyces sp. LY-1074]MDR5705955.1 NAD(P)H-binding protein [Agromyces sp. LY-1358]
MKIAVAGGTGAVGRHVVERVRELGHEAVVLTRSAGVDLVTGTGLAGALDGVDAVIDVASVQTQSAAKSREFFGAVTRNLLAAEAAAGVRHHVALSIVGTDLAPEGYYAGKQLQEQLVEQGAVPWTILRATQFFDFPAQILSQTTFGPIALVPKTRSQPIAAREVAVRLVDLATDAPAGRARDLAGPREERMADLARRLLAASGKRTRVLEFPLPGVFGRALRNGTLLPAPGAADLGTQTFDEWLAEEVRPRA